MEKKKKKKKEEEKKTKQKKQQHKSIHSYFVSCPDPKKVQLSIYFSLWGFFNLKIQICNKERKERNVLFNYALNTFYLWLYGFGHMVKDHSDSKRENLLLPLHRLCFTISSKRSFICSIPQTG